MPAKDAAAYMREYRAKKKGTITGTITPDQGERVEFDGTAQQVIAGLSAKILELTDEVARLKRELANRPEIIGRGARFPVTDMPGTSFGVPHAAPKPGSKKK